MDPETALSGVINDQYNYDTNMTDFIHHHIGAYNVYYVKYGGFALKFMSPSLSGTYR